MYTKVLVPVDETRFSKAILTMLESFLDPLQSQLTLLHVASEAQEQEQIKTDFQRDLADWQEALQLQGFNVQSQLAYGNISDEIVRLANDFDLIAMTTHARAGLSKWVLGSVAEDIFHKLSIPVVFYRPEGWRES